MHSFSHFTKCINCAACSNFAPATFSRNGSILKHVVHQQPKAVAEISQARAALTACPVAAIRIETLAERRHRSTEKAAVDAAWTDSDDALVKSMSLKGNKSPFPKPFLDVPKDAGVAIPGVFWTGHHNEASFGATPYLVQARHAGKPVWIMVDTPKYSEQAVRDVLRVTGNAGPDYLFLTHVDDTADHGAWAERLGIREIFHSGDLGKHNWVGDTSLEDVEILLPTIERTAPSSQLIAYSLDGTVLSDEWQKDGTDDSNVVILHTPGHSPGSITLYKRPEGDNPGILFTGDTYAWTVAGGGRMTGFGRYGNDLLLQVEILDQLMELDWDVIAPGHGHPRDYRALDTSTKALEMKQAQEDLALQFSSR